MNSDFMPILNDKIVSERDFRKLCRALSYEHTVGGKVLFDTSLMHVILVPNANGKNIKKIREIMGKYNIATDEVKRAVSTGALPNLYEYKYVVRMIIENNMQSLDYKDFKRLLSATMCQKTK